MYPIVSIWWARFALPTLRRRDLTRRLGARHRKSLVALCGHVIADLPVGPDAADIGHEDARLAGDVGAHVPGIGLRIERRGGDLVDMGDPSVLGLPRSFHGLESMMAHVSHAIGDPVDMLL